MHEPYSEPWIPVLRKGVAHKNLLSSVYLRVPASDSYS